MLNIVIAVLSSFVISVILVAITLRLSHKKSWYDQIDERKIHTGDVPRLGGIGFSIAFIVVALVISFIAPEGHYGVWFVPVIIAMLLILFFGAFDDFRPLAPRKKLMAQIIAGLLVILPNYAFQRIFFFDIGPLGDLNWIRYPLSLFWIVGLSNAVNLIDGVDGLAGGISMLAVLTYAAIFASFADTGSATLLCLCLAAAIGGFLVFNLPVPRAKIFMGDGGSQFLGFILAVLPLVDKGNVHSNIPLPYAAALLMIPIFDTTAAVWRRVREGRRIDSPDRAHIHHKLMNLGLRARGVDGVLYSLQILLGILVFISIQLRGTDSLSLIVLGAAYFIGIGFFAVIHFMNRGLKLQDKADLDASPPQKSHPA
jgi:UDP-GlcNAc:undecaprenyl-phosphate GlcNAc-1-phosphate transferase